MLLDQVEAVQDAAGQICRTHVGAEVAGTKEVVGQTSFSEEVGLGEEGGDDEDEERDGKPALEKSEQSAEEAVDTAETDSVGRAGEQPAEKIRDRRDEEDDEQEAERVRNRLEADKGQKQSRSRGVVPRSEDEAEEEPAERTDGAEKALRETAKDRGGKDEENEPVSPGHANSPVMPLRAGFAARRNGRETAAATPRKG